MNGRALLPVALLLAGCGAEPRQWLVSVATDAPVPQFGDHIVLEVLGTNASCDDCLRIIGVDAPESLPVSFGVRPQLGGSVVRVRARLYRSEQAGPDGLPVGAALIDAAGDLPPLDGETRVAFDLSMACFGVQSELKQGKTCDAVTGTLAPVPVLPLLEEGASQPAAGSWPAAAHVPCEGAAPEGMVCVQGGAFILGTPRPAYVVDDAQQSQPEHLVQLSPFAMDVDEVTVGAVNDLVAHGQLASKPTLRDEGDPTSLAGACTYRDAPSAADRALPVNCVSRTQAQAICAALGKRLPTEAEWEYTAGNLAEETQYPWGDCGDLCQICQMAVIGLGRENGEGTTTVDELENPGCRAADPPPPWGPVAGGNPSDVTVLGIRDLAGSMTEWVADDFAPYDAPCWQPAGTLLVNPICQLPPSSSKSFSIRGSSWAGYKLATPATARGTATNAIGDPYTGLRCVVSR